MPEEEFSLTPEQMRVLQEYAEIRSLEVNDVAGAVAIQEVIRLSGDDGESSQ